ncbi:hypothetical protein [Bradyrhizobium iriomotense]|uniref:SGNH/GDSL hydrolase family protein n=1 Tax=Bradyrhizobium iriomotense TaxID=441950 RepID=A0ABQ6B306_9BRAD|nr:hypothetical protein [Bradyrhizobium iriomotense]GLR87265.1 hypothetical protein GCM10007857_39760 [Bradyrhizobium iriomotense]
MQQTSPLPWLIRCAATAAALLLACGLATAWIGAALQQPAVTTRDGSLITLNRYVSEPVPDVVLVGSSVTWRLKEEYFSRPHLRNLALAGGSPVTGLAIIAKQPRLPKIVLIETNVLSRAVDEPLVERFSGGERTGAVFLRPVRTAIAALETWSHTPPDAAKARAEREDLLRQPPSAFDNHIYLERAVGEMNAEEPSAQARANTTLIKQLIGEIERRGGRAYLIAVPFSPEIEKTSSVTATRTIAQEAFPDHTAWLTFDEPLPELRWADGVHLDERSALIVARAIEKALAGR